MIIKYSDCQVVDVIKPQKDQQTTQAVDPYADTRRMTKSSKPKNVSVREMEAKCDRPS